MITTPDHDRELIRGMVRDSRVYAINGSNLPSVTSIVSAGEPKPALINWAKKATATHSVANLDTLATIKRDSGEMAAIDYAKRGADWTRDAAAELGSKLHEVAEAEVGGFEYPLPDDPRAVRMVAHLRHFLATMNPEWLAIEAVVYSETHGYAGTFDAAAIMRPVDGSDLMGMAGVPVILDWKSGSGVYGSHALQVSAYAHAEFIIDSTGHLPLRDLGLSTDRGLIVHVGADGWKLHEIDISDWVFSAFLSVRDVALWSLRNRDPLLRVLAHGSADGGRGLRLRKKPEQAAPVAQIPPEPADPAAGRRRIRPPSL